MVNQQIYLPMIPDSAPIVINISQYDYDAADYDGRLFFNLISNGVAYDMDGATAIIQGDKPDGTAFAYQATVVNDSVVRVNVRQQMTMVAGRVVCQLVLSNTDGQIGSFNVWLEVQPASGSGTDPSQTDIPALVAIAQDCADQAQQALINIQTYSANPPYIGANGNWFVWDAVNSQYTDTGVYAAGIEGNLWYSGTTISGKDPTPTVYPTGIPTARQGDMYLNKTEGAIYQCTLGGPDTVAKWSYVMTLTGGGSGGTNDYVDLDNKPQINGVTLLGNKSASDLGVQTALTAGFGINLTTAGAISAKLLAGANVTLTNKPDGSIEIAATGGGGGATTLGGLSDVSLTTPQANQVLLFNGTEWVNAPAPAGGHTMLPTPSASITEDDIVNAIKTGVAEGGINDDVPSLNTIGIWSNCDAIAILGEAQQDDDGIGVWNDDWESTTVRTGWLWSPSLYQVLEKTVEGVTQSVDDIKIEPVFNVGKSETVGLLSYRIDDDYPRIIDGVTVNGGCVAFKFTGAIKSASVVVGVSLVHQRTNVEYVTPLS